MTIADMFPSNHYAVLGLSDGSTQDEVKKAFRALAMQHHPDKGGDLKKFQSISASYTALLKIAPLVRVAPQQRQQTTHININFNFNGTTWSADAWERQQREYKRHIFEEELRQRRAQTENMNHVARARQEIINELIRKMQAGHIALTREQIQNIWKDL